MNKTLKERAKELYDNLFNSAPHSKCEREVHFEMALFIKELAEAPESGPEPVAFITREGITASKKQVETNTASTLTSSFTIPLYTTPPAPSVPDGYLYTNVQSGEYHVSDYDDDYRGPEHVLWHIEPVYRRTKGQR